MTLSAREIELLVEASRMAGAVAALGHKEIASDFEASLSAIIGTAWEEEAERVDS